MKNKIKTTGTVEYQRAISYLEEVLEKMKSGDLVLSSGENSIAFHSQDAVELEIEAKEKEGKQEFSFEMVWKEGLTPGEMGDFSISGGKESAKRDSLEAEAGEREFHPSDERTERTKKFKRQGSAGECVGVSGSVEAPATCSEL